MAMKNPPHPGQIIQEDCVKASGLSSTQAADRLGVPHQILNDLLNENSGISPEMAVRLEKMGWSTADHWLGMQMAYDLAQVRAREDDIQVHPTGP